MSKETYTIRKYYQIEINGKDLIAKFYKWLDEKKFYPSFTSYASPNQLKQLWLPEYAHHIEKWLKTNTLPCQNLVKK